MKLLRAQHLARVAMLERLVVANGYDGEFRYTGWEQQQRQRGERAMRRAPPAQPNPPAVLRSGIAKRSSIGP